MNKLWTLQIVRSASFVVRRVVWLSRGFYCGESHGSYFVAALRRS